MCVRVYKSCLFEITAIYRPRRMMIPINMFVCKLYYIRNGFDKISDINEKQEYNSNKIQLKVFTVYRRNSKNNNLVNFNNKLLRKKF